MKLKYEFEKVEMDDQIMAVPVGEEGGKLHAMLRLNETASFILDLLREETTEEKVLEAVLKEYEGDENEIKAYISEFIAQLRENEVLA